MINDPKNPYSPNLDTESAKIAKTPLLGIAFANLPVKYYLFIKSSPKFLICDPKKPNSPNLNTQSAKIAKTSLLGVIFANLRVKY